VSLASPTEPMSCCKSLMSSGKPAELMSGFLALVEVTMKRLWSRKAFAVVSACFVVSLLSYCHVHVHSTHLSLDQRIDSFTSFHEGLDLAAYQLIHLFDRRRQL
jgi:hypothetical protein